jgi:hypothetical protein
MRTDSTPETNHDAASRADIAPAEIKRPIVLAIRNLESAAVGLSCGVVPALVLTGFVILVGTRYRSVGLVVLSVGTGIVAALVLATVLGGFAALLRRQGELNTAARRLEERLAIGFERLAAALERANFASESSTEQDRARALADIRRALREGDWSAADALVREFIDLRPDDPDAVRLTDELAAARESAAIEIRDKLEAAREANDPERVIELHDALRPLLAHEALHDLDRDLAKWFLLTIHRRLLSRTVSTDLAALAARVGASLDGTPEGASLRASLPILRRAAGLCSRCAQPYVGIDNACPVCLGTAVVGAVTAPAPVLPSEPEDDGDPPLRDEFADALVPDD